MRFLIEMRKEDEFLTRYMTVIEAKTEIDAIVTVIGRYCELIEKKVDPEMAAQLTNIEMIQKFKIRSV